VKATRPYRIPAQRERPRRKRIEHEAFLVQASSRPALEKKRKATRVIVTDGDYAGWLVSIGSVISGGPAVFHHLLRTPTHEHGMGKKVSDDWGLPLTDAEHKALHACGDEDAYLLAHFIHGPSLAALLRQLYGQPAEVVRRAIRQHREAMGLRQAA
jgi:hypothetical protein